LEIAYLNLKHLHRVISFFIDFCKLIKKYVKTDTHLKINNAKEKELKLDSFKRTNYKNKDTFSPLPFISILIASYNESVVIDRLLASIFYLDYDIKNYEVIIVDDSDDDTSIHLKQWQKKMDYLRIFFRHNREGWKGGALNKAIDNINSNSTISLVVDADNVLRKNTLLQIASLYLEKSKRSIFVIQGYPMSTVYKK
jgi:cellulose synthase/poly-beta-1,6-N-acetylglucosamine synthase-like glycosyltransferase